MAAQFIPWWECFVGLGWSWRWGMRTQLLAFWRDMDHVSHRKLPSQRFGSAHRKGTRHWLSPHKEMSTDLMGPQWAKLQATLKVRVEKKCCWDTRSVFHLKNCYQQTLIIYVFHTRSFSWHTVTNNICGVSFKLPFLLLIIIWSDL